MKNIFSSLFDSVVSFRRGRASAEIIEFMHVIQDSEQSLVIGLGESSFSFPSVVRALNDDHQVFVIESRQSIAPIDKLRTGMVFTVQADNNGCLYSFKAKFIEPLVDHNSDAYVLQFPKAITVETSPVTYH